MQGKKIGYVRVSTVDQNTARQEVLMKELGVEKIYIDKVSGKNKDRKQLTEMLNYIREGDMVIVESISRIARNTKDLLEIVDQFKSKGVEFVSKKESIDTNTPAGKFMLTVFGAIAELERGYILDRQKEGIAIAKKEGKYKGRKPISVNNDTWENLYKQWKAKEITATKFMNSVNLKANTFYRKVKAYEEGVMVNE
ncbi:MAG TPA: recombinase family protein [Candidatus Eremiobacteraeota bacterium]|nr:recombinase family protein [Candidatus Eremiobacteraeota bacterium]